MGALGRVRNLIHSIILISLYFSLLCVWVLYWNQWELDSLLGLGAWLTELRNAKLKLSLLKDIQPWRVEESGEKCPGDQAKCGGVCWEMDSHGGLVHSTLAASGSAQPKGLSVILMSVNSHHVRLPWALNRLYVFMVGWKMDATAAKHRASTLGPALSHLSPLLLQSVHTWGLSFLC